MNSMLFWSTPVANNSERGLAQAEHSSAWAAWALKKRKLGFFRGYVYSIPPPWGFHRPPGLQEEFILPLAWAGTVQGILALSQYLVFPFFSIPHPLFSLGYLFQTMILAFYSQKLYFIIFLLREVTSPVVPVCHY